MLRLSATNSSTPSAQLSLYQGQLQQARREAVQAAERVARLEQQTEVARNDAVRADERVRGLENDAPKDRSAGAPRRPINTLSQLSGTVLDVMA